LQAAERLALLISAAKPAIPVDEEPGLDVLSALPTAAFLTHTGELRQAFLVGWQLLGAVSLSSEERGAMAGDTDGLAFLFPFEEQ